MRAISNHQLKIYRDCPQRWNYMYEGLWVPRRTEEYLNRGTLMHKILEIHYRDGLDAADQYIRELLSVPVASHQLKTYHDVIATYREYIPWAREQDKFWDVLGVEFEFIVPTETPQGRPFAWKGYIDLIVRDRITKEVLCIDHKTTDGEPRGHRKTRLDPQLPIYGWAIKELGLFGGKVDGLVYNFLNVKQYSPKRRMPIPPRFNRRPTFVEEKELNFLIHQLNRSVDEMHMESLNDRMNIDGERCSHCIFQTICEARMKGIDPTPILVNNFDQRLPATVDLDERLI